jgi:signal transduction histidine kinase
LAAVRYAWGVSPVTLPGDDFDRPWTYASLVRALIRLAQRIHRVPPIVTDAAIGAGVFAAGLIELLSPTATNRLTQVCLLGMVGLGLLLRRRQFWVAITLVALAQIVALIAEVPFLGGNADYLALMVLIYTVAERRSPIVAALALGAGIAVDYVTLRELGLGPGSLVQDFPLLALAWFVGRSQLRRHANAQELDQLALELREEHDGLARDAVAAERARIVRDLHALVVLGVEEMSLATREAKLQLDADAAQATDAIGAIELTGRDTLMQMRRLLSVLRNVTRDGMGGLVGGAADFHRIRVEKSSGFIARGSVQPESQMIGLERSTTGPGGVGRLKRHPVAQQIERWIAIPRVVDVMVVLFMAALAAQEAATKPFGYFRRPIDIAFGIVVVAILLVRRNFPIVVLLVVASTILVWNRFLSGDPGTADRALLVAVYTVAALRGPRWAALAILVEVGAYTPLLWVPGTCDGPCLIGFSAIFVFAAIAGNAVREGRRLIGQLQEQTEVLRRTRGERVRLAVTDERFRVARDLHDMVAHGVTVMVVQAGAARALARTDPQRARQALIEVDRMGQQALRELGALLDSLRSDPLVEFGPPSPIGQDGVRSLVEEARNAGLQVELLIEGEKPPLDPALEISIYRIVQESLTNVRKHAPGAPTWVTVRHLPDAVEVETADAGSPTGGRTNTEVPGAGQGLIGVAERAALFGGHAEAGPTPEGGFRVQARLPREPVKV